MKASDSSAIPHSSEGSPTKNMVNTVDNGKTTSKSLPKDTGLAKKRKYHGKGNRHK